MTIIIILATFVIMVLGVSLALAALISAAILLLIHYKKSNFSDIKSDIEWKIIITFAIMFILSNSLAGFGFSDIISAGLISSLNNNIYLAVLITLCISSLLSAFLAGTPVTIILLPIISSIIGEGFFPNPIIIAFIGGVNMAGNFLPQGSACDMLTLSLAKKYEVVNLDYRRLLKTGSLFANDALFHYNGIYNGLHFNFKLRNLNLKFHFFYAKIGAIILYFQIFYFKMLQLFPLILLFY